MMAGLGLSLEPITIENPFPGIIMAFREGLEGLLILVIILKYLDKTGNTSLKKNALLGLGASIVFSLLAGLGLRWLEFEFEKMDKIGEVWESVASLVAVGLVTTFIIWMINNGGRLKKHVEESASKNLTGVGLFLATFFLVSREGLEIAIFAFAGQYTPVSIFIGLLGAVIAAALIHFSLVNIKINLLFKITLAYLVIQAGFLLGYGLHEGLSAFRELGWVSGEPWWASKVFDLSGTWLDHKVGAVGLPLYIVLGWYSKPEWLQFIAQYLFTGGLFYYWIKRSSK